MYRGFAILGIFVVNIGIMNSTFIGQAEFAAQWTSGIDRLTERILQLFFYTKFFPIFSLLFGLGISMQAIKLKEKGKLSRGFFFRRMLILFLIGLGHILFLWSGDVLNIYALLGLLVVPLLQRPNKLIIGLSCFLLLFPFYHQVFSSFLELINYHPESFLSGFDAAEVHRVISQGSYMEGLELRVREYLANIPLLFAFLGPLALSMFLLGLYLGKNKVYLTMEPFIHKLKNPMLAIAVVTNIYRLLFLFVLPGSEAYSDESLRLFLFRAMELSDVVMGIFYLWFIGWLWFRSKLFRRILKPLRHAGRMALTNYIMQSFIGLILFSSAGFALYESLSPFQAFSTAVAVFCFQVVFSKLWLSYFRFGPLEWVWRCLTYKRLLPIRRSAGPVSVASVAGK